MKVFYVIYVQDEPYRTILNGIRALANPREKHSVHLTVQGPFSRRRSYSKLSELNTHISGERIAVNSVGRFFGPGQNTVFLSCYSEKLPLIWRKTQYGYNPHLTLYDGDRRDFAESMLRILQVRSVVFDFLAHRIEPLIVNGQRDLLLAYNIDYTLLEGYAGQRVDSSRLSELDPESRLGLIDRLASCLDQSKRQKCAFNAKSVVLAPC